MVIPTTTDAFRQSAQQKLKWLFFSVCQISLEILFIQFYVLCLRCHALFLNFLLRFIQSEESHRHGEVMMNIGRAFSRF